MPPRPSPSDTPPDTSPPEPLSQRSLRVTQVAHGHRLLPSRRDERGGTQLHQWFEGRSDPLLPRTRCALRGACRSAVEPSRLASTGSMPVPTITDSWADLRELVPGPCPADASGHVSGTSACQRSARRRWQGSGQGQRPRRTHLGEVTLRVLNVTTCSVGRGPRDCRRRSGWRTTHRTTHRTTRGGPPGSRRSATCRQTRMTSWLTTHPVRCRRGPDRHDSAGAHGARSLARRTPGYPRSTSDSRSGEPLPVTVPKPHTCRVAPEA